MNLLKSKQFWLQNLLVVIGFCSFAQEDKMYLNCDIAINSDQYIVDIIDKPKKYIRYAPPDCKFRLLDTMTYFALKGDSIYLEGLNEIRKISDGETSEYFMSIASKLFYQSFPTFTNYLFLKRHCARDGLEVALIDALSMEISTSD